MIPKFNLFFVPIAIGMAIVITAEKHNLKNKTIVLS